MKIASQIIDRQNRDEMLRRSLERIIQLYTDKTHFVYELLQNAEDSGANSIKFIQYPDRLEVFHDGHPFTTENLQGLCDIGQSDKINDLNQIGEFGVGFKSVFGICEIVKLYSNPSQNDIAANCQPFSIEIQDFTKPVDIENKSINGAYTTCFVFPYAVGKTFSGFKSLKLLNETLSARLKNLGVTTLLFMKNLELIEYEIKIPQMEASGTYILEKRAINDHCTLVSAIESENKKKDNTIAFLKFTKVIDSVASMRTVDIAFSVKLDKDGKFIFKKAKNPYISVYFPTETESKLDFIVQGPYRTTPNRSSVPANDEENENLVDRTAELLRESILEMREMGCFDISLIKILPLDEESFDTYSLFYPIYEEVWNLLQTEKILPAKNGNFIFADEALIARSQDLANLFTDAMISELFNEEIDYKWLPTIITETGPYKEVFYYFRDVLDINVVRPEDLKSCFNSNPEFLEHRDNEWLIKMYKLYETIPNVFQEKTGNILDAKFIKTARGDFVAPYRKNNNSYLPNIFLPSKVAIDEDINMVHPEIFEKCRPFFERVLHLQKPNEYEFFIKAIEKRYADLNSIDKEQYIKDIKTIIKYIKNPEYTTDICKVIKESFAVKTKKSWERPFSQKILFPQSKSGINLEIYYKNISTQTLFVDFDWYQSKGLSFEELEDLGVSDNILINENQTWGEYYTGNPGRQPEWRTSDDFRWKLSIDKLEEALCYVSKHPNASDAKIKSNTIFRLLVENQTRLVGTVWIGGNTQNKYDEPAEVIHILRKDTYNYRLSGWNGKWLYTESNELVSQKQISKHDLNTALYGKVSLDSDLYELLGFNKNKVDQIEAVIKDYDMLPEEKKKSYFAIELERRYGITVDDLNKAYSGKNIVWGTAVHTQENEEYEFPVGNIKNWDALKKHAAQILCYASPVNYGYVVRHIRVSRPQDDIRAYLMNMYRVDGTYSYACQLCHTPHSSVEMCQLEPKPEVELDPLNLCLCPNCARKFRKLRNDEYLIGSLIDEIVQLDEDDINEQDHVSLMVGGNDFWFTQIHIAEIREIMMLKSEAQNKHEDNSQSVYSDSKVSLESGLSYSNSSAEDEEVDESQSDLSVFSEYVGKRVFHKTKKEKATVTECDGSYITLKFDSDTIEGNGIKYDLELCLRKQWLQIIEE